MVVNKKVKTPVALVPYSCVNEVTLSAGRTHYLLHVGEASYLEYPSSSWVRRA